MLYWFLLVFPCLLVANCTFHTFSRFVCLDSCHFCSNLYILRGLLVNIILHAQMHSFLMEVLQSIFGNLQVIMGLTGPIKWLKYSSETIMIPIVIYEV